jgi:two-component sensor histidine kinase
LRITKCSIFYDLGDNGIGFLEHVDFRKVPSLGLQLVNSLAAQLYGKIELVSNRGTEFRIASTG